REIDVAPLRDVGGTGVDQGLDHREYVVDVLRGARKDVGGQDVHRRLVGVEGGFVCGSDLGRRFRLKPSGDEHPVLAPVESLVPQVADIGDVLDVQDIEAVVEQDAPDEVSQQIAAQVADMRIAVHGRSA